MQIIHIAPLNCQKTLIHTRNLCYVMCLTHLVESNYEYAMMFREFKGYKILDNSLIELGSAVGLQRVLSAARDINAQEIILPDVFQDGPGTLKVVQESIEELRSMGKIGEYKLMAVAHGKTVDEWVWCFQHLQDIPEVDVIGIPKITAKLQPGGRPALESIWRNSSKTIHLLGLWYTFEELEEYCEPDRIRSVDTCQAAFLAKYHMNAKSIRPDGFTIDLQDPSIDHRNFMCIVNEVGVVF